MNAEQLSPIGHKILLKNTISTLSLAVRLNLSTVQIKPILPAFTSYIFVAFIYIFSV